MTTQRRYFDDPSAAMRYAAARPYVHPAIVRRMCVLTGCDRFDTALDVGCGTGQSTLALAEIATQVVGIDPSGAMLAQALPRENINYYVASAEALPVPDSSVELITVGLAWHWFEAEQFLSEVQRILQPRGWLVIYNNFFAGTLPEQPQFGAWYRNRYLANYPTPPRQRRSPQSFSLHTFELSFVRRDQFTLTVLMTQAQFVNYLLTQSNSIAKIELGTASLETVTEQLLRETETFFNGQIQQVPFGVDLDLIRRE